MLNSVHGILLLDKPHGITSNAALQRAKRLFKAKKAGHTGSLDPIATGMLPLCFGEATKFSQFLLEADKTYHVVAKLGIQTTTGDSEGDIVAQKPVIDIHAGLVQQVMQEFLGTTEQIPPMYSAIKYQGKPLYELARRGIEIARKARQITIHHLTLESMSHDEFTFSVHCSKGTYVRTLVEDIGHKLGCGAHVTALRRVSVAPYGNAITYTLSVLEAIAEHRDLPGLLACLLPVETAVQVYPAITLSTATAFYLRTGQAVRANFPIDSSLVRLLSEEAKFLGVGEVLTDGRVKPHRLVSQQQ
jgi:tRNA pseudouridine55 synthase